MPRAYHAYTRNALRIPRVYQRRCMHSCLQVCLKDRHTVEVSIQINKTRFWPPKKNRENTGKTQVKHWWAKNVGLATFSKLAHFCHFFLIHCRFFPDHHQVFAHFHVSKIFSKILASLIFATLIVCPSGIVATCKNFCKHQKNTETMGTAGEFIAVGTWNTKRPQKKT